LQFDQLFKKYEFKIRLRKNTLNMPCEPLAIIA
jgi:hypothetical protein